MSDLPWVRFFPSDWLAGTSGLPVAEIGVYITVVATMYERGTPIPENDTLRRRCGCTTGQFEKAISSLVGQGKLLRVDGGLWNKRVDQEHGLRIKRAVQNKEAAEIMWRKKKQNQQPLDASAELTHSIRNASQISKKERYLTTSEYGAARASSQGSPALGALPHRRALTEAERGERLMAALNRNAGARGETEGREEERGASSLPSSEAA